MRIVCLLLLLVVAGGLVAAEPAEAAAQLAERIAYWEERGVEIPEKFRLSVKAVDIYARCYLEAYDGLVTGKAAEEKSRLGQVTPGEEGVQANRRWANPGAAYPIELPNTQNTIYRSTVTVPTGGSAVIGGRGSGASGTTTTSPGGYGTGATTGMGQGIVEVEVIELE